MGTENGIEYFDAVQMDEPVIDTNSAGDALAVGFLTSYLSGKYSLNECVLRGQICARFTCNQKASTSTLISGNQLEFYFAQSR